MYKVIILALLSTVFGTALAATTPTQTYTNLTFQFAKAGDQFPYGEIAELSVDGKSVVPNLYIDGTTPLLVPLKSYPKNVSIYYGNMQHESATCPTPKSYTNHIYYNLSIVNDPSFGPQINCDYSTHNRK